MSGRAVRVLVGYGLTANFSGSPAFQILRVHPAGTGSNSFHLTNQGIVHPIPEWLFLVPSRSVVITGLVGGRAEIRDWTCNRSVMTNTTGEDMFVRMFPQAIVTSPNMFKR